MTVTSGQNAFSEKGHTLSELGPGLTLTCLAPMGETRGPVGRGTARGPGPPLAPRPCGSSSCLAAGPLTPPSPLQESIAVRSQSPRQLSVLTRGLILLFAAY